MVDGRAPAPTFTKGGFSTVWGGASLPIDAVDMTDWPVSRAELDPYFQRVADLMPLCGGTGTLSEAFPPYKEPLGNLQPSPQGQLLLEDGSRQADLWGANYYPGRGRERCIEYTALINIRPAQGNRSMEIQDPATRQRVRELTFALIGEGEPLG